MAYLKLLRIPLLLLIAIAQLLVHYGITTHIVGMDYDMPVYELTLFIISTMVIVAGGFVINDYYDMRIDEINHPLTRIVGNEVSKKATMNLYIALFVIGIILVGVLGFTTSNINLCFIQITIIGLLWFYSSSYKRTIGGNFIIALSLALIPFTLAIYEGSSIMNWWMLKLATNGIVVTFDKLQEAEPVINQNYMMTGYISIFVFLFGFIHEVERNLYEENGERELECHTIPIVYGEQTAKNVIYGVLAVTNIVLVIILASNYGELKLQSVSYYVCTVLAFSVALYMFTKNAQFPKDYTTCLLICKLLLMAVVGFGIIYGILHPNNWVAPE